LWPAARPKALSVETPAQAPEPCGHWGEYRIGGQCLDRAVQPIAAIQGGQHRVKGGIVGLLQTGGGSSAASRERFPLPTCSETFKRKVMGHDNT
jgi:hypothetical protein